MRLLLDTHIVLWSLTAPQRIGERTRAMVEAGDNELYVSAVTIAEAAIKSALGKLRLPDGFLPALWQSGFEELPLTATHGDRLRGLPSLHKDPFDRMLVVQAQAERLTLVTVDRQCMAYDVEIVDARR